MPVIYRDVVSTKLSSNSPSEITCPETVLHVFMFMKKKFMTHLTREDGRVSLLYPKWIVFADGYSWKI